MKKRKRINIRSGIEDWKGNGKWFSRSWIYLQRRTVTRICPNAGLWEKWRRINNYRKRRPLERRSREHQMSKPSLLSSSSLDLHFLVTLGFYSVFNHEDDNLRSQFHSWWLMSFYPAVSLSRLQELVFKDLIIFFSFSSKDSTVIGLLTDNYR